MSQLDVLGALLDEMPLEPAKRTKRSLGPRPAWNRFWEKVDRTGDCWMWTASTYENGYGQFTVLGQSFKAHRWAYLTMVGPVSAGLQLDHACHTADVMCIGGRYCPHRRCVNPAHLELVTGLENNMRGNSITAENARKTECDSGHPFDAANTRITREGWRDCRRCHAIRMDRYRKSKRRTNSPP